MRIGDWSSDVCSSDLEADADLGEDAERGARALCATADDPRQARFDVGEGGRAEQGRVRVRLAGRLVGIVVQVQDWKSVVLGRSGSVRVDLGGRVNIKQQNNIIYQYLLLYLLFS